MMDAEDSQLEVGSEEATIKLKEEKSLEEAMKQGIDRANEN